MMSWVMLLIGTVLTMLLQLNKIINKEAKIVNNMGRFFSNDNDDVNLCGVGATIPTVLPPLILWIKFDFTNIII